MVISGGCSDDLRREAERALAQMEPYFDHRDFDPEVLQSAVLNADEFLAMPRRLTVAGGYLVVSDMASDQSIHVFDRDSGLHVGSFGRRGDGPGEFMTFPELSVVPGQTDIVYAFDPTKAQVTRLEVPGGAIDEFEGRSVLRVPTAQLAYGLRMLDQSRAVSLGFFRDGRLGFFDLLDGDSRYTGSVPEPEDAVRYDIAQQAYQSILIPRPDGKRFAVLTNRASQIEIYDEDGRLLSSTDGPYAFPVDYLVHRRDGYMAGPRNRFGYSSGAATNERIFALFSGRAEGHFRGWRGSHAEFLHVLDWNGQIEQVFRLDREVLQIALGESGTRLYALTDYPEPAILTFEIPEVER